MTSTDRSLTARLTELEAGLDDKLPTGAQAAELGLDVADGTPTLPMPTVVVVDGGRVAWLDVHPNYVSRTDPADILAAVSSTGGPAGADVTVRLPAPSPIGS